MRTDEEDPALAMPEAGSAYRRYAVRCSATTVFPCRGHRRRRARPGPRTDHGVLIGRDRAEDIPHPGRAVVPRLAMNADWSSSAALFVRPSAVNTSSQ